MRALDVLLFASALSAVWLSIEVRAAAAPDSEESDSTIVWEKTFERALRFHNLVDADLLLAGTSRHLYAFDPATGEQRWRERNVNPAQQDVYRVPGSAMLLVADASGGPFDDADTHVLAIDAGDGQLIWETPRLTCKSDKWERVRSGYVSDTSYLFH